MDDHRRPRLPSDVVQVPAAAAFTPPAPTATLVGEIIWHIGDTGLEGLTPGPWLSLIGQEELITDYPALAGVVGIMWEPAFGASSPGHFRLPNLSATFPLAAGAGYPAGTKGGAATHQLTVPELAVHDHPPITGGSFVTTSGAVSAQINAPGFAGYSLEARTGGAGAGQPHNNMPPYVAISAYVFTGRR